MGRLTNLFSSQKFSGRAQKELKEHQLPLIGHGKKGKGNTIKIRFPDNTGLEDFCNHALKKENLRRRS